MILQLFTVNDGDNVINKTMSNELSLNVNLKRDVDISSPLITLMETDVLKFDDYNYAALPDLNRFYFVRSVTRLNNRIVGLNLECDVLETYKADILASNARYSRQIKTGDYFNGVVDESTLKTITKHESNVTIGTEESMILTSVGEV